MKKVRYAVIGTGGLAQSQHIPNLTMSENSELAVLCDLNKELLDKLGVLYQIDALETDYKKVLDNPEIDAVVIATREDTHMPISVDALKAGKHVYVEKPLAETAEECQAIMDAEKASGKYLAVGMNRRLAPAYQYANELLWQQGGPKNMFYRVADSYSLDWGQRFGKGQRVLHEVCHVFDILRFFARSEVESIYAMSARDDDEQYAIKFKSGTIASVLSSGYVQSDMPKEHFEAIAEKGSVVVDDFTEVRRFSFAAGEDVKRFAGHYHPAHDMTHVPLFEEVGLDALYALRRKSLLYKEELEKLIAEGNGDSDRGKQLQIIINRMPLRSYSMNKGWLDAINHFSDRILNGRELHTASSFDALQVANITKAAIESRETGIPVKLNH